MCGISTGQAYADSILGLLWGASETSYFPFLSWVMYPMAGVAFGHILKNSSDRRRLYMQSLLAGCAVLLIAMCVSGFRFMYYMGFPEENAYVYYHQDLIANAVNGSLALLIGFNQLMFWQTILAMAIIVVAADRITAAYAGWQRRRRGAKPLATAR